MLPNSSIAYMAHFAEKNHINVVAISPFSEKVNSKNEYFTRLVPNNAVYQEYLLGESNKDYTITPNLVVLYPNNNGLRPENLLQWIKKNAIHAYCYTNPPSDTAIEKRLVTYTRNIVFMPLGGIENAKPVYKVMSNITAKHKDMYIHLYGMPAWHGKESAFEKSKPADNRITVHIPLYYDYNPKKCAAFNAKYKATYSDPATDHARQGYETLFWYAFLLKQYGNKFNDHYDDTTMQPFGSYTIRFMSFDNNSAYYINKQIGFITGGARE